MSQFQTVSVYGRHRGDHVAKTLSDLLTYLAAKQKTISLEKETARILKNNQYPQIDYYDLGKNVDLVIVVGGDGSLLHAARVAVNYDVPLIGINRGRLGFLTDIAPNQLESLDEIFAGNFSEEKRFLLNASIQRGKRTLYQNDALNDVVLLPGKYAHMIRFDLKINDQFVCTHRADGLIISTPTGSTAYALSGGGPILEPTLDAIALVPMFPHSLSSRPIVIPGNDVVALDISSENETSPYLSCDGQERAEVAPGDQLIVQKKKEHLRLLHPKNYHYFQTLREKLGWQNDR